MLKRFAAHGWAAKRVDGHDPGAGRRGAVGAMRSHKPTLIACRTIIGLGAPTKAGTAGAHGAPLGPAGGAGAKAALGWTAPPFTVPEDLLERWHAAGRTRRRARGAPG